MLELYIYKYSSFLQCFGLLCYAYRKLHKWLVIILFFFFFLLALKIFSMKWKITEKVDLWGCRGHLLLWVEGTAHADEAAGCCRGRAGTSCEFGVGKVLTSGQSIHGWTVCQNRDGAEQNCLWSEPLMNEGFKCPCGKFQIHTGWTVCKKTEQKTKKKNVQMKSLSKQKAKLKCKFCLAGSTGSQAQIMLWPLFDTQWVISLIL